MSKWREWRQMLALAARTVAGRRYWLAPLLTLIWPIVIVIWAGFGNMESFEPVHAQNLFIGIPMVVLGMGLGGRVIAGEIDRRTLEIAYTVPGGAYRVWLSKLAAVAGILLASELLLGLVAALFTGSVSLHALYGAFQGAFFYAVLTMGFATLAKSETTGLLLSSLVLLLNFSISGSNRPLRINPMWNALSSPEETPIAELAAHAVQNRIGFLLLIVAIVALTFGRAERREKLLS